MAGLTVKYKQIDRTVSKGNMVIILNILLNIWGAQTRSDPVLDDMHEVIESKPCWNPVK